MSAMKNLLDDILEEFEEGLSIKEISQKHNLSYEKVFMAIVEYCGSAWEEV